MKFIRQVTNITFALCAANTALAGPITTFRFSGSVSSVGGELGNTVVVGDAYQADFTFDEAIAQQFNFGNFALYKSILSEIRIFASGGTVTWTAFDPLSDDINNGFTVDNNNSGRDAITFSTGTGQLVGASLNGNAVVSHSFNLSDPSQTAFSSAGIPLSLNPSAFVTQVLNLTFEGSLEADIIRFDVGTIIKNPPVPEPAESSLLAGMGLLGLAALRRRRA